MAGSLDMIKPIPLFKGMEVTFNITEDCNLRCKYCYELNKQKKDLSLSYAKRFIDLLLTDPDPIAVLGTEDEWILKQGLILDFIGGDALVRPHLVEDILNYFMYKSISLNHKWALRWRASISTNGTLFDEPYVKEFLMKFRENLCLGISIDGCPEIHNLNRDNSMDAILKNWNWYKAYAGKNATTKSTLNKDSIPYLHKSLKFLHEYLGLQHINMNFIFEPMGETKEDLDELDRQMASCVDYVLEHKDDLYWSMLDKGFMCGSYMRDPDDGWCGSGAMPALGINGKIYPCFRFLPHTMSNRELDFHVGDLWNGFDHKERFQEVRNQTRKRISPQKCLDCPIESGCAWCIGGAYSESGCFYRQTNICEAHKIQDKWAKIYWERYNG
jgi:uncharacterized protein